MSSKYKSLCFSRQIWKKLIMLKTNVKILTSRQNVWPKPELKFMPQLFSTTNTNRYKDKNLKNKKTSSVQLSIFSTTFGSYMYIIIIKLDYSKQVLEQTKQYMTVKHPVCHFCCPPCQHKKSSGSKSSRNCVENSISSCLFLKR